MAATTTNANSGWTKWIDDNQQLLIDRLREAVRIPSVSGDAAYRPQVFEMVQWTFNFMQSLGIEWATFRIPRSAVDGVPMRLTQLRYNRLPHTGPLFTLSEST